MRLTKDGQVISLDNEDHINAFLASGWAEAKASVPTPAPAPIEQAEQADEQVIETKTEAKKPVGRKKQEKR